MPLDLNLSTVELTSTLRTAPLNGSPSSSDYNESQRETLVDLAALADFVNNEVIPLVNALPATALEPSDIIGIEGRTVWTDTSDESSLFFDALSSTPLTVADTIRILNGIVSTMSQQLTDLGVEVASLQARLASTSQNDIALALQNLSSALNQVTVNQQIQETQITQLVSTTKIVSGRTGVVTVPAGSTAVGTFMFLVPFSDNFYTAVFSVEMSSGLPDGLVTTAGFVKNGIGLGVTVALVNYDTINRDVIVHVLAEHD
jgi:hypothetical protein